MTGRERIEQAAKENGWYWDDFGWPREHGYSHISLAHESDPNVSLDVELGDGADFTAARWWRIPPQQKAFITRQTESINEVIAYLQQHKEQP